MLAQCEVGGHEEPAVQLSGVNTFSRSTIDMDWWASELQCP